MPTKEFWEWQRGSKLCRDCTEEPKDCMRCEIIWDAALKSGTQPTTTNKQSTPCPNCDKVVVPIVTGRICPSCYYDKL